MHAFTVQDVDRSCKRCWNRRNKDGIAPIVKLFNDKSRKEALVTFKERGLPDLLVTRAGQLLSETPYQCVAWDSFEQRCFHPLSNNFSYSSAHAYRSEERR